MIWKIIFAIPLWCVVIGVIIGVLSVFYEPYLFPLERKMKILIGIAAALITALLLALL